MRKTLFDTVFSMQFGSCSLDQHSHHAKHGWVGNMKHTLKKKNPTNKFNTHFTKTHYKQTLERNENGRNVQVFLAAEWWMKQRCYFWRGMKTYFSSLLMMLICSQSPNMQMKCATTIKWIVLRRWGRFKQHVCKIEMAHNFVTCAALCVRAPSRSLTRHEPPQHQEPCLSLMFGPEFLNNLIIFEILIYKWHHKNPNVSLYKCQPLKYMDHIISDNWPEHYYQLLIWHIA